MTQPEIITAFCDQCNDDREYRRELHRETHQIRGVEITADLPCMVCSVCDDVQPDPTQDSMAILYAAYRAKRNMLTPEQIREIREQYDLSREAFAKVLGMSPASLYRYEAGALQDDVHDNLIRACQDSIWMACLVQRKRDELAPAVLQRFEASLEERRAREAAEALPKVWFNHVRSCLAGHTADRSAAMNRLFAVERELEQRLDPIPRQRLPYMLFLVDMLAEDCLGKSILKVWAKPSPHTPSSMRFEFDLAQMSKSWPTMEPNLPLASDEYEIEGLRGDEIGALNDQEVLLIDRLSELLENLSQEEQALRTTRWITKRLRKHRWPWVEAFSATRALVEPEFFAGSCTMYAKPIAVSHARNLF